MIIRALRLAEQSLNQIPALRRIPIPGAQDTLKNPAVGVHDQGQRNSCGAKDLAFELLIEILEVRKTHTGPQKEFSGKIGIVIRRHPDHADPFRTVS